MNGITRGKIISICENKKIPCKQKDFSLFDVYAADPRFPELNVGLPFFVITDAKGHLLFKTTDYLQTEDMALFL